MFMVVIIIESIFLIWLHSRHCLKLRQLTALILKRKHNYNFFSKSVMNYFILFIFIEMHGQICLMRWQIFLLITYCGRGEKLRYILHRISNMKHYIFSNNHINNFMLFDMVSTVDRRAQNYYGLISI